MKGRARIASYPGKIVNAVTGMSRTGQGRKARVVTERSGKEGGLIYCFRVAGEGYGGIDAWRREVR